MSSTGYDRASRGIVRRVRKAVIDIGSNSVLLLVEEQRGGRWQTVVETSSVTSLGEGTKQTGLLSESAMVRTLDALKRAHETARNSDAISVVAGATMAVRIARNADDFIARAEAQETPVIVLSGAEEAELGFRAVANDPTFERHRRLSIIDVGGQSTELVTAERSAGEWRVLFRRSYPIGTLGLRGTVLAQESPGPRDLLKAIVEIDDTIGLAYLPDQAGQAIVLGATGTNLVTIRERITNWEPERVHGAWLDFEEVSKAVGWLCTMSDAERAKIVGIEPGREKTLHIGALILERFLHAIRTLGCAVSVRGWRHALLENGLPNVDN